MKGFVADTSAYGDRPLPGLAFGANLAFSSGQTLACVGASSIMDPSASCRQAFVRSWNKSID
jgi:hypothetical protein